MTRRQGRIQDWRTVALSLLYLVPPLLLILKQPDFGTAIATCSIWAGMMFFGGARWQHLVVVGVLSALVFVGAYKVGVLKPHQVARLTSFVRADDATRAAGGYQLNQRPDRHRRRTNQRAGLPRGHAKPRQLCAL